MRLVESAREGFSEPVVEVWRDDEFVGQVYWDEEGEVAVVNIYPDEAGDVIDVELGELLGALEMAERIVTPEEFQSDLLIGEPGGDASGGAEDWSDEHPSTLALVGEFDPQAAHRSEDGEGFFPRPVAQEFIRRCDELDLAVVEMEGFDLEENILKPRPNLNLVVRVPDVSEWAIFRPAANATAFDTLTDWPVRSSLVVAFVVQQPDGETFVA